MYMYMYVYIYIHAHIHTRAHVQTHYTQIHKHTSYSSSNLETQHTTSNWTTVTTQAHTNTHSHTRSLTHTNRYIDSHVQTYRSCTPKTERTSSKGTLFKAKECLYCRNAECQQLFGRCPCCCIPPLSYYLQLPPVVLDLFACVRACVCGAFGLALDLIRVWHVCLCVVLRVWGGGVAGVWGGGGCWMFLRLRVCLCVWYVCVHAICPWLRAFVGVPVRGWVGARAFVSECLCAYVHLYVRAFVCVWVCELAHFWYVYRHTCTRASI